MCGQSIVGSRFSLFTITLTSKVQAGSLPDAAETQTEDVMVTVNQSLQVTTVSCFQVRVFMV